MKFSIIIPAHNAAQRLWHTTELVQKQTFTDYELIIVCDSCTDNTAETAIALGADKVIITDHHNDGLARSEGLDIASGDYVLFMDDDDRWCTEFQLECLARMLDENPESDIICMGFYFKGYGYKRPMDNDGHLFPNVWSKCWKRSAIGDTRFPEVYSVSDFEFCKAMSQKKLNYIIWDFPWYYYNYLREGSISELAQRKGAEEEEQKNE